MSETTTHLTEHAIARAKERLSLSKDSLQRLADKAFNKGLSHGETKGHLRKYITAEWFKYRHANNIRVFGECIFFFCGERLLTVYQLPPSLKKWVKC